ncbi:MAG TPA: 2-C-methyl-D-erythritol 4-phosphate cytidylyltransferase [Thermomicrobiales bacterium]|jgi:2-C-methyl-D-erythritol 4-phosphate cytidylyltransferase
MSDPDRSLAAAVIVGAGRGTRFGAADKVMAPLAGRPLLAYSLDAAEQAEAVGAIVVVTAEHCVGAVADLIGSGSWSKIVATVTGGDRRQDSVWAGLAAMPSGASHVAVHDAARPLVTSSLFDACIAAARRFGAAIAAAPVADTLKRVVDGRVVATVSRRDLWAAQTPQAFRLELLMNAFASAAATGLEVTDEASLLEAMGIEVAIVPSSRANLKITHPEDLAVAEAVMRAGTSGRRAS